MTEAFCVWAILASVPVIVACNSHYAFTLADIEQELERRIAEPEEDDEPAANDNGGDAA